MERQLLHWYEVRKLFQLRRLRQHRYRKCGTWVVRGSVLGFVAHLLMFRFLELLDLRSLKGSLLATDLFCLTRAAWGFLITSYLPSATFFTSPLKPFQ
jgi:hypothetical protein